MTWLDYQKEIHAEFLLRTKATQDARTESVLDKLFRFTSTEEKTALRDYLNETYAPPFRVRVADLHASNGLTYVVMLERTDLDENPMCRSEGAMSVVNRHDVDEANSEGYAWAGFLGVPFTPCKAVEDTAETHTVREGGTQHAADILKLVEAYKDISVRIALARTIDTRDVETMRDALNDLLLALKNAKLVAPE